MLSAKNFISCLCADKRVVLRWVILDSRALTKVQSAVLIAVVLAAAVGGGAAYVLWSASLPPPEDIRIGFIADLDMSSGKALLQAVMLAAEQVNAEGGVLGRNFTVIAEDDDSETLTADLAVASNAMTKLITVDNADYVVAASSSSGVYLVYQDICAEQKKILFGVTSSRDELTQRVLDDYDRYKYFFKFYPHNTTTVSVGMLGDILTIGNYTGFTKVALLFTEGTSQRQLMAGLNSSLPSHGFSIVYSNFAPTATTEFGSYFAAIEASGAEILVPMINNQAGIISFIKEWHDRQSPCVVWGVSGYAISPKFWEWTEGKCEFASFSGSPAVTGYPLTSKTLATREAYLKRWGTPVTSGYTVGAYDGVRFILPDAIRRAGTTETEAVIKALETTDVETSMARHFVFTGSHDIMVGTGGPNDPEEDYVVVMYFQYQANGTLVPVKPEAIMKEARATYQYPNWQGPWSK